MTTVRTPRADAGTVAVAGAARTLSMPDDLVVLPDIAAEQLVSEHEALDVREALPGDRLRRLQQRRRLVREEILAVMFLIVVLAVTVGVLAMQWLGSGGPAS